MGEDKMGTVRWPLNPEALGNLTGFTDISGRIFTCGEDGVTGFTICSGFATAHHSDGSSTSVPTCNIVNMTVSRSDTEGTAKNSCLPCPVHPLHPDGFGYMNTPMNEQGNWPVQR